MMPRPASTVVEKPRCANWLSNVVFARARPTRHHKQPVRNRRHDGHLSLPAARPLSVAGTIIYSAADGRGAEMTHQAPDGRSLGSCCEITIKSVDASRAGIWDARDMQVDSRRRMTQFLPSWAAVAQFGQAYWLFGNLYEAVVDVPQLLVDAHQQRSPRLLGPGSPVRYYAPLAPLTIAATTVTLIDRWRSGGDRTMIILAAASTASAGGLTAYLVRTVNLPLLHGNVRIGASGHRRLIRTWHRVNAVRLATLVGASLALRRTAAAGECDPTAPSLQVVAPSGMPTGPVSRQSAIVTPTVK